MADDGSSRAELLEPLPLPRKPRGRPLGSKNKPKPPVFVTRESAAAMRPVVLELAAGCEVSAAVSAFARRRRVGVSVLCGRGAVASVTLRLIPTVSSPAAAPATAVTLHGRFEILSLSGTVLPSSPSSSAAAAGEGDAAPPPLSVSLAGVGGQVIGGTLAGEMTVADDRLVVVAATFGCAEVHRLPPADSGEDNKVDDHRWPAPPPPPQQQQQTAVAASAVDVGMLGYGGAVGLGGGAVGGEQVGWQRQQQQAEMVMWAQTSASVGPAHPATSRRY